MITRGKNDVHDKNTSRWTTRLVAGIAALLIAGCSDTSTPKPEPVVEPASPNILFVVLDDVGMDQLEVFGFGGNTPPATPTIAELADAGVSFTDTWAMPACSVTRAAMFEGRFPLRTNIKAALGLNDLANSMTSPYTMTIPKLLARQGYQSALIGKFHIAMPGNYPAGNALVHDLGWDYYAGWLDRSGDPTSIDTTAGGIAPPGTYSCGFVPSSRLANGADVGACYFADGSCSEHRGDVVAPGRSCRDAGGILDPNTNCQDSLPEQLDFSRMSAHSVSPVVYNHPDGAVENLPPTDASIAASDLDCSNLLAQRKLSNLMLESMDLEIGRLLVAIGLASSDPDGNLVYAPEATDTMVVILGDNGTLGNTVKEPFDLTRSKGSAYQTGVWVPLIVSGPLVSSPGRQVTAMVNVVDLYALFGEIAGIGDVGMEVPRTVDAVSMLPYLINPEQPPIREWNYTEVGLNLQANGEVNGPCVINSCTQIPNTRSICEDNNGVWWGTGNDASSNGVPAPEEGFEYCSQVLDFVTGNGGDAFAIQPLVSIAVRNENFKLVENTFKDCGSGSCMDRTQLELFEIDQPIDTPWLDKEGDELPLDALSAAQEAALAELTRQLADIRASVIPCPGDGNIDGVVDETDLQQWEYFANSTGLSSVYDLNLDGLTDTRDEAIIRNNLGLECSGSRI